MSIRSYPTNAKTLRFLTSLLTVNANLILKENKSKQVCVNLSYNTCLTFRQVLPIQDAAGQSLQRADS
jgi:hypothetical protein